MDGINIETLNLILRAADGRDAQSLARGRNTPFVQRYNLYEPCTAEDIARELKKYPAIAIIDKRDMSVIGCIYVKDDLMRYHVNSKELSGWMAPEYAGKGLMTEALSAVIPALLKSCERLSAWVFAQNEPSLKLMKKVGFVYEGTLRGACRRGGELFDMCLFSMDISDLKRHETNIL